MKGSVVALDQIDGRRAAALIEDGILQDFLIDGPAGSAPVPGTVFRAICDRPLKGQGAMIVRLPGSTGFLRQANGLRQGRAVLAQVTGYAETGKAVPLTTRVLFKSRYAIVTPGAPGVNVSRAIRDEEERVRLLEIAASEFTTPDAGLILRSVCEAADADAIADDIRAMSEVAARLLSEAEGAAELLLDGPDAHTLAWRDWAEPDDLADQAGSFALHGVDEMIDAVTGAQSQLPGGAHAYIEATRALVAVDVNTGADTSPAAGLKANIALARDLPRLLRCKGMGGQITIDFAPTLKKDRRQIEQVLKASFRRDSIETALAGWTPLGHFELQRKRERLPLSESLP